MYAFMLVLFGGSQNSCVRQRAVRRNHVWSYDFVADRTEDGRALKLLVVIDEFTRECLALEDARWVIDRWRLDDNHQRRHRALN